MKVTKKVINIANQIAKNTEKQRKLNAQLNAELDKMGLDYQTDDFALIFSTWKMIAMLNYSSNI